MEPVCAGTMTVATVGSTCCAFCLLAPDDALFREKILLNDTMDRRRAEGFAAGDEMLLRGWGPIMEDEADSEYAASTKVCCCEAVDATNDDAVEDRVGLGEMSCSDICD